jgi:transposase
MAPAAAVSEISGEQRGLLERWVRAHGTPQSVAMRARIVLLAGEGHSNSAIARDLDVSRPTVILWRERFKTGGPHALWEVKPGPGAAQDDHRRESEQDRGRHDDHDAAG